MSEVSGLKSKEQVNDEYFDTIWSDDMYSDALKAYENEPWFQQYKEQLMANPYLRSKQARFTTDPLTGLFNYEGAAAKYYGAMRQNAMDWLDKNAALYREQYYNSASQQVAREQSAGLNPDLTGGVDAGAAAENDSALYPELPNGTSESGMMIAQAGMSFISGILSFGKQIQDLNIGAQNKIGSELAVGSGAREYALNELAGIVGTNPSKESVTDALSVIKPNIFSGYSRGTRKYLEHFINRYKEGDLAVDSLVSELRNRVASNNQSTAEIMSSPWYSPDLNEYINNVSEHFMKYIALQNEYNARVGSNKSSVEDVYWNDTNNQNQYGSTIASEMNARRDSADSTSAAANYQKQMESEWSHLMSSVKGDGKHWYNTIGMILIMALRSQVMQPLHFGFSSSNSSSMGKNGVSNSSSRGFHF